MFQRTLVVLVTLLIVGTTAFADKDKCKPEKVPGSYVLNRTTGTGYIDLLKLSSDGTAYWYQSTSFDFFVSQGSFIPEIGSWKCLEDGSVLVTTVGTNYAATGSGDVHILENVRFTQKLSVVDNDTLQPTHRINTHIPLLLDPFGPGVADGCSPSGVPCAPFAYKRVKPLASDIP